MDAMSLLFRPFTTRIDGSAGGVAVIDVDAIISSTHTKTVTATKHPVERGAKITDHLRPDPDVLVLEGLISDTPISREQHQRAVSFAGTSFVTTADSPAVSGVAGYAKEAFDRLSDLAEKGVLCTIVTLYKTYSDMALTSFTAPRDAQTGDALRFSATFEKIVIVQNKITTIRPAKDPRAQGKVRSGRQALRDFANHQKVLRKVASPWAATASAVKKSGGSVVDTLKKFRFSGGA